MFGRVAPFADRARLKRVTYSGHRVRHLAARALARAASAPERGVTPSDEFHSWHYLRHNQRRQEHLASLALPLQGRTVLETGAGIGDHTTFFLDRGCTVTVTEPREENLTILRRRFPHLDVVALDLDAQEPRSVPPCEVVYSYGTLYHLSRPAEALAFLAAHCTDLMLLETAVSAAEGEIVETVVEASRVPSQAISGQGSRPSRGWVRARLREHFPYVYLTTTQPWHDEFPLDWRADLDADPFSRAVFVASRKPLDNPVLTTEIPVTQIRH